MEDRTEYDLLMQALADGKADGDGPEDVEVCDG